MSERKVLNVNIENKVIWIWIHIWMGCLFDYRNIIRRNLMRPKYLGLNGKKTGNSQSVLWFPLTSGKPSPNRILISIFLINHWSRCKTCGEYIYRGKKFNARKEDVIGKYYLGIQIYRFYIKCTKCLAEITFLVSACFKWNCEYHLL